MSAGIYAQSGWSIYTHHSLVPVEMDGLIDIGKNIGVSSVVRSALRVHGQMMLCGQAGATLAWLCLRDDLQPRAVAADARRIREIQRTLARGTGGPGVLLWPFHDLPTDHPAFGPATLLTVAGVWRADADSIFFQPEKPVTAAEWTAVIERVPESFRDALRKLTPATRGDAVRALATAIDFDRLPMQTP